MTHDLANPASPVAPPAGPAAAPGLVQTVAPPVSEAGDTTISTVPVVDQLVPGGSVSAVSAAVGGMADQIAAGVAEVVAAPAAEAVPALEPALQPVADLLTRATATPLPLPAPTVDAVLADLPSVVAPVPAAGPEALEALPDVPGMLPEAEQGAGALPTAPACSSSAGFATVGRAALANTSAPQAGMSVPAGPASGQPLPVDPATLPAQVPAAPASGTGSGASSGGAAGAAAWLSPAYFGFERPGAVPAGETFEHAPAPVSFDPGSSPD
ncbi:hypothetical protein [Arthrobacter sp. 135MFCol5.1]|uniref:hypothetical protein n=1 Tax=Arthrobacter sp. 135MFCol5.1 TaxID=1158050 RepID=UPI001E5C4CD6|nr:hypothetical protein [Arthrobacter sp. 135MFCol5.1]